MGMFQLPKRVLRLCNVRTNINIKVEKAKPQTPAEVARELERKTIDVHSHQ